MQISLLQVEIKNLMKSRKENIAIKIYTLVEQSTKNKKILHSLYYSYSSRFNDFNAVRALWECDVCDSRMHGIHSIRDSTQNCECCEYFKVTDMTKGKNSDSNKAKIWSVV